MCVLPGTHAAVQLLVKLRCEQVEGQDWTPSAWQSCSVTSTMPLRQPEQPLSLLVLYVNTEQRQFTDLIL